MATDPKSGLLWVALATSFGVHAASALGLAALPRASFPIALDAPVEVEITVDREAPTPPARDEDEAVSEAPTPVLPTTPRAVLPHRIEPPRPVEPPPSEEPEVVPEIPELPPRPERHEHPTISLDPRAVARAAIPLGEGATGERDRAGSRGDALEHDLNVALGRAANARDYVGERPPPDLHSMSDGTFVYDGHVFTALIEPDGTVQFSDRPGVGVDSPALSSPRGVTGQFDLNDAMQRAAGNDPFAAERRWFLRETEAFRDQLADRQRLRDSRRGAQMVRRRLETILSGPGSDAERRRRVFELWDECAEDEVGGRAREAVIAFVRERLPEGSLHAYTDAELARLNGGRESRAAFSPYD